MIDLDIPAVLSSLVAGELARIRKLSALDAELALASLNPMTGIGNGELGTDSLDLLQLASAVAQMFHLHETGVEEYLLRHRTLRDWAEIVTVSLSKKAEHITFRTSGSTGKSKSCVHQVADLQREVAFHASSHTESKRILALVPRHHIFGFLWTVMLPRQLGVGVLDARRWPACKLAAELHEGDLLVGTPPFWEFLNGSIGQFPLGVNGVTSGAPCPAALFTELSSRGLQLVEVYGSSETGGIGMRSSPGLPFTLMPLFGNRSDALNAPDRLEWIDSRHFFVGTRHDGAVQVRGLNVFPEQVAAVIRSHPCVLECAVRLMSPEEGDRLKAFVVLKEGVPPKELDAWMIERFPAHERPGSIVFGSELPRNQMGKLTDWSPRL